MKKKKKNPAFAKCVLLASVGGLALCVAIVGALGSPRSTAGAGAAADGSRPIAQEEPIYLPAIANNLAAAATPTAVSTGVPTGVPTAAPTAASTATPTATPSVTPTAAPPRIDRIEEFIAICPQNDPAYPVLRRDFVIRLDGQVVDDPIPCTEPYGTQPIEQLTNPLVVLQVLRIAYYMHSETAGKLPWTGKGLYDWMVSSVGGVNIVSTPGKTYCCDWFGGRPYFVFSAQDANQREGKRTWSGLSNSLNFYAHEIRHAAGGPGHVAGCAGFPSTPSCDATYDLANLGSYGVQYWLTSSWVTGAINVGMDCAPPARAAAYAEFLTDGANQFRERMVSNPPPAVTATPPYGGPCSR